MDRRYIMAIVLVFLILFLWPLLFSNRKKQTVETPPQREQQVIQKQEIKPQPKTVPKIVSNWQKGETTTIQTPLYEAKLASDGARIVSWKLKEYSKRTDKSELIDLIPNTAQKCLTIQFHDPNLQDEMSKALWKPNIKTLNLEKGGINQGTVEFIYTTSNGIEISKRLTFSKESYLIDVDVSFSNLSPQTAILSGYDLCWGPGLTEDELVSPAELATDGPAVLLRTEKGAKFLKHWQKSGFGCFGGKQTLLPSGQEPEGPLYWVDFSGKYFAAVLIPGKDPWWSKAKQSGKRYSVTTGTSDATSPNNIWQTWGGSTTIALTRRDFNLPIGKSETHKFQAYVGPKKWSILQNVKARDSDENLRLGKMIYFGTFTPLGKATLWLLQTFYNLGKNFGISIIFISVLIKLLYLPLTQKSFNSMNKMQELQPKLNELKEKYRDDPQQLNKATMKLYKQFGASPLSGCLPLLLQIPVFWALFSTLRGAVELRGAIFIAGWVNDLSLPDTIATIAGLPIRILPLLMTGSTLAQQLYFGTGGQGQNNKIMAFMPVFMLFIFYGMPSGLVLYWFCNDIFTFGHRFIIKRNQDKKPKEPNGNEKMIEGKMSDGKMSDGKSKPIVKRNPNKKKKR